jgi:hypothetical protein
VAKHFIIPDCQVKPGVAINHLEAAGNYIVDKQPDTIIHLGDHWDMGSLSRYDVGKKSMEGRRYKDDIDAGKLGMETLLAPLWKYNNKRAKQKLKQYKPRMVFLEGNHENRVTLAAENDPKMYGTLSLDDCQIGKFGWEQYKFLHPVVIDGVSYAHYFYNPNTGHPYGGKASSKLTNVGFSFTMGHQQGKDQAEKYLANGKTIRGLVAGSFYQHIENYKGPQANDHWQGCIVKHEVKDGNYCLMELSLDYLVRKWL